MFFNYLLQQDSQRIGLHQGWYLCWLVTESIPSSAKFAPAVVHLGQSLPEYPRLFPEWQKNWPTVKYEYFNTRWINISVSEEYLKICKVMPARGGGTFYNLILRREVRAESLHRTRLVGRGRGSDIGSLKACWLFFDVRAKPFFKNKFVDNICLMK